MLFFYGRVRARVSMENMTELLSNSSGSTFFSLWIIVCEMCMLGANDFPIHSTIDTSVILSARANILEYIFHSLRFGI